MMLHRAATAGTLAHQRACSPRGKPSFVDGSTVEERDKTGRIVARYRCGKLLGRGGFAKCYEFTNLETNEVIAAKVIDRSSLTKSKTLQKLHSEIAIHRRMKHKNIVNFFKTFQDEYFVYILLEKCQNQTLMEVSKTRRRYSTAETQFIMIQTMSAIQYMHENNIIHRDLKLGNMMLDEEMNIKIGDFGLAAELAYDGERKRTICGTPNYIAPEILEGSREGHSFEVDVWSLGVILYTLLVGDPPFQTADVKTTYNRIKQCRYTFPANVDISEEGKNLVHKILQSRPDRRPSLVEIRAHPFFRTPVPPLTAPLSLFPDGGRRVSRDVGNGEGLYKVASARVPREPLKNLGNNYANPNPIIAPSAVPTTSRPRSPHSARDSAPSAPQSARGVRSHTPSNPVPVPSRAPPAAPMVGGWCAETDKQEGAAKSTPTRRQSAAPAPQNFKADDDEERHHFTAVHDRLHQTLHGIAASEKPDASPDLAPPTVWVTDYADFSQKYGLSYRLNTGHTGVHYNDSTKMVWEPITNRVEYYARVKETINGVVHASDRRSTFHMDSFPENVNKKVTLIKYFKSYLTKAKGKKDGVEVVACSPYRAAPVLLTEPNMVNDMIYVKRWLLTNQAMIFRLSNKTIQVCFFDNTEVILSSESKVVTYGDTQGNRRTIALSSVPSQNEEVASRLRYTKDILCKLINNREL